MGQSLQQLLLDKKHSLETENGDLEETLQFLEEHSPFMRWLERLHLKSLYFEHQNLVLQALSHSSFVHEQKDWKFGHNERLEFLGDAVLDYELSHLLWEKFPELNEGELSRFRSSLVNEETLASWAQTLGLQDFILLGRGEAQKDQVEPAILADAFEALLGAASLGKTQKTSDLINLWIDLFDKDSDELGIGPKFFDPIRLHLFDPKTRLQELTLEHEKVTPEYSCEEFEGAYRCRVDLKGQKLGQGIGSSKKKAEIAAARNALLKNPFNNKEEIKK